MTYILNISYAIPALAWIALSSVLFTVGDFIFRYWIENSLLSVFIIGFFTFSAALFCLIMSFPHENIAVASVLAILINITLYLIVAYFVYGDVISIRQSVGLLLGFASIYVLEGMK
jgi:multidrug transporter EmrE-like cation transporter